MQLSDGGQGDVPVDENKLHGKPDKTLRFSLCSDNLEGISLHRETRKVLSGLPWSLFSSTGTSPCPPSESCMLRT